jgi:GWxTD domain-containing protein
MSYQKAALRLALAISIFAFASAFVLAQDSQDPNNKPRNVKPELKKAYKDWLDKDVTYIITDEERKAFKKLATDDERERFIEEFWRRRDPDPDTDENEFKEEYYERIAYANEHFSSGIPGWKTDRGRIWIMYGKPMNEKLTQWAAPTNGPVTRAAVQRQPTPLRFGSIATLPV